MRWLVLAIAMMAAPVAALDLCDDLWFTRNLVYDGAGYCFGSALGQAVFDNNGCTEGAVALSVADKALVARVQALEAEVPCKVDTKRSALNIPDLASRRSLIDLPVASAFESACIGWKGERLALHVARDPDASVSGAARPGDTLLFQFEDEDGWSYVEVLQNEVPAGAGWARVEIGEGSCAQVAG